MLKVSYRKPYFFMMKYDYYAEYEKVVESLEETCSVNKTNVIRDGNRIFTFLENDKRWYFLEMKKDRFKLCSSRKEQVVVGMHCIPILEKEQTYHTMEELQKLLTEYIQADR